MSSWGNYDAASNVPLWIVMQESGGNAQAAKAAAPTAANAALLFQNTTPNAYFTNETVGVYMVDAGEAAANKANSFPGVAHSGWVVRTDFAGARAGRVQYETIVALSNVQSTNTSDNPILPDASITFLTQPSNTSVLSSSSNANSATFAATVQIAPASATVAYQWLYSSTFAGTYSPAANTFNNPANTSYRNDTTNTLRVVPFDVDANNYWYKLMVTATNPVTGAVDVVANSSKAMLTVTAGL